MEIAILEKKLARLETLNDQLETELSAIDVLMKEVGFSEGIATIKAAASEILENKTLK